MKDTFTNQKLNLSTVIVTMFYKLQHRENKQNL
jgi:hypothetical protein